MTRTEKIKYIFDMIVKINSYIHNGYRVEYDGDLITSAGWESDLSEIWFRNGQYCKTMIVEEGYDDLAELSISDIKQFFKTRVKVTKEVEL